MIKTPIIPNLLLFVVLISIMLSQIPNVQADTNTDGNSDSQGSQYEAIGKFTETGGTVLTTVNFTLPLMISGPSLYTYMGNATIIQSINNGCEVGEGTAVDPVWGMYFPNTGVFSLSIQTPYPSSLPNVGRCSQEEPSIDYKTFYFLQTKTINGHGTYYSPDYWGGHIFYEVTFSANTNTDCQAATGIGQDGLNFIKKQEGHAGQDKQQCDSAHIKNCIVATPDPNNYGFYDDPSGFCTTGYGHLVDQITKKPNHPLSCQAMMTLPDSNPIKQVYDSLSIVQTKSDAEQLLNSDLSQYEQAITDNVHIPLNQQEFDALTSLIFNIGIKNFENDQQLLQDLNNGNFDAVPDDLMSHVYSKGKILQGLVDRRTAEGQMFQSGTCQPAVPNQAPSTPSTPRLSANPSSSSMSPSDFNPIAEAVHSDGNDINIDLYSSSTISDFNVNDVNQQISFQVSGEDGTEGSTIIPISLILQGPYTVTFDNMKMTNYTTDVQDNETIMILKYHHSTHQIIITGTSAVPEFPFTTVILIIGIIVTLTITRMKRNQISLFSK